MGNGGREARAAERVMGEMIFWNVFVDECRLERIVNVSSRRVPLRPDSVTIDAGEKFGNKGSSQKMR